MGGRLPYARMMPLSTSLHRYEIPWTRVDWPLDREAVFGFDGPLDVEIGFGNGDFLADLASSSPERQFVGIERSLGSLQRLFSRLETRGLENVRVIQADASFAFDHLFGPGDVSRLFVNFPDPWPKERHHGRRLIQPAFIDLVSRRLVDGGELLIGTDHADYAVWIEDVLTGQTALTSKHATPSVPEIAGRTPTKYEQKAREIGSTIHFFEWTNTSGAPEPRRDERVDDMPNVLLEGSYDADALLDGLEHPTWKFDHQGVVVVVKVGNVYRERPSGHLLVEMMVREGAFAQHFGISIIHRPPSRLLVKLSPIGHPRPTWGVKQAVRVISERLAADADLQVVSSTLPESSRATA